MLHCDALTQQQYHRREYSNTGSLVGGSGEAIVSAIGLNEFGHAATDDKGRDDAWNGSDAVCACVEATSNGRSAALNAVNAALLVGMHSRCHALQMLKPKAVVAAV